VADSDLRVVLVDKLDREVNDRYQVATSTTSSDTFYVSDFITISVQQFSLAGHL